MRFLIVSNGFDKSIGGVETYLQNVVKTLRSLNHEVEVLCQGSGLSYTHDANNGYKVHRIPYFSGLFVLPAVKRVINKKHLSRVIKDFDPDYIIAREILLAHCAQELFEGSKILYIPPSIAYKEMLNRKYSGLLDFIFKVHTIPYIKKIEEKVFKNNVRVMCFSKLMQSDIESLFGLTGIKVNVPGIDARFFKASTTRDVSDQLNLLTVSRLTDQKNIILMIRAMQFLPHRYSYTVVGDGVEMDNLKKECARLGVDDRVALVGYKDDVDKYYRKADVYVHPAYYEPFGHIFLEAMASGLPIVANREGEIGAIDFMVPGENILLADNSPQSFSEYIASLSKDDIEKIGSANRVKAHGYTWKAHVSRLLRCL